MLYKCIAGVTIDTEKLSKNKDCNINGKLICFGNVTCMTMYIIYHNDYVLDWNSLICFNYIFDCDSLLKFKLIFLQVMMKINCSVVW